MITITRTDMPAIDRANAGRTGHHVYVAVVCAASILANGSPATAQSGPPPSIPISPGLYDTSATDPSSPISGRFVVHPNGRYFTIEDGSHAWSGDGQIYANSGSFTWKSESGRLRLGRAEFEVGADGTWHGRMFGSGVNTQFTAKPEQAVAAVGNPQPAMPPPGPVSSRDQAFAAYQAARRMQNLPADQRQQAMAETMAHNAANLPGLEGQVLRALAAGDLARSENRSAEAMRAYRSIDADGPTIFAEAGQLSAGYAPGARTPYDKGLELIQVLARAQREIGVLYENGRGVNQDYSEAARWYQKALSTMKTRQGVEMVAITRLGFLYANGLGVPKDRAKARELFAWRSGSAFTYLLDHDRLPPRLEDVTPAFIETVKDQVIAQQLTAFLMLVSASSGGPRHQDTSSDMGCPEKRYWFGSAASLDGCWP